MKESKRIAGRIDVRYIERPNWLQWWRRWIVMLTLAGMLAWAGWVIHSVKSGGRGERMFNPGPVTAAHARFEHACGTCHGSPADNAGRATFSKVVSDAACLNCHDAGAHHPLASLHPDRSLKVQLIDHAKPTQAANCVACHIEHRGHEAMVGRDDRLCLQCHTDLKAHEVLEKSSGVAPNVGAFPIQHPEFGRRLMAQGIVLPSIQSQALPTTNPSNSKMPEDAWLPNLALKFNHRSHLGPDRSAKIESCSACHSTAAALPADLSILPLERQNPPQLELRNVRGHTGAMPGGQMQPVRYEAHCRACHALGLPITPDLKLTTFSLESKTPAAKTSVPAIAHDRMEMVRAQLADVDRLYLDLLLKFPEGSKLLNDPQTHKPRPVADWLAEQRMQLAARLVADGAKEFFPADFQKLAKAQAKLAIEMKKKKPNQDTVDDLNDEIEKSLPKARESIRNLPASSFQAACEKAVATLNVEGNCAKCHVTEGQVMDAAQFKASLAEAGTKPFATLPTGLTGRPKRWFEGASFNHDKHRDMACLDCHAGMDKDEDGKVKSETGETLATHVLRLPGLATCAACHTPDTAVTRGAGTACVTCHDFHDRSLERDTTGLMRSLPKADPPLRFSEANQGRAGK